MHTPSLALAAAMLAVCPVPTPDPVSEPAPPVASTPKPPCEGEVVVIQLGAPFDCDVHPPQMLVLVMDDDPGPVQHLRCHDSGGRVMHDPAADRFYCLDIDY